MNREGKTGERDGAGERDGKFSLSLARWTLCTNMINKKLIICCLRGVLSSSPVRKVSFFHALSEKISQNENGCLSICFSLLPSECVCVSWCGWHLAGPLSSFEGFGVSARASGGEGCRWPGELIQNLAKFSQFSRSSTNSFVHALTHI